MNQIVPFHRISIYVLIRLLLNLDNDLVLFEPKILFHIFALMQCEQICNIFTFNSSCNAYLSFSNDVECVTGCSLPYNVVSKDKALQLKCIGESKNDLSPDNVSLHTIWLYYLYEQIEIYVQAFLPIKNFIRFIFKKRDSFQELKLIHQTLFSGAHHDLLKDNTV